MSHTGRILYHYLRTLYRRRNRSRHKLERWQNRQVQRHIRRVRAASSFYREWWAGQKDTEWREFPLIDKAIMMEHFDELNTVGITKQEALDIAYQAEQTRDFEPSLRGITIGLSSGTSGNRGVFLVSPQEQDAWTGTVLAKLLPGGLRQECKIAFFLRANSNLYESVKRGKLQFRYFDLTVPLDQHIQVMEQYQPDIWVAPASLLRLLADAAAAGQLTVKPRKLVSVAEVLDPLDRQHIEQAFGQIVHQVYQCTEGFLGASCEHGTIHLNEDIVCIEKEYIDTDSRRFVPIITDFSRTTQPIIRYRLNDILTEAAQPCPCGSPFTAIERIEGRYDDILYIRHLSEERLVPLFPDLVTRVIMAASPDIEHYQVIQHPGGELEVAYRLSEYQSTDEVTNAAAAKSVHTAAFSPPVQPYDRERLEQEIVSRLEQLCVGLEGSVPAVRFTNYEFVPGAVKLRRVERRWQLENP